jgi:hypothetical protein
MTIRDDEIIRDKLHFLADRALPIHITLKKDNSFRNGKVMSFNSDSIIFFDEKLEEILIYFYEIKYVDKREERR